MSNTHGPTTTTSICMFLWMTRYLIWYPGLYLYVFVDDKVPYMAPRIIFVCFCGWQGTLYGTLDYFCMFLWMTSYLIWHPGLYLYVFLWITTYLIWHPRLYLYVFVDDKVPYMAPWIIFVCFCGWQGTLYGTPDYICMFLWMTRYLIWHPRLLVGFVLLNLSFSV